MRASMRRMRGQAATHRCEGEAVVLLLQVAYRLLRALQLSAQLAELALHRRIKHQLTHLRRRERARACFVWLHGRGRASGADSMRATRRSTPCTATAARTAGRTCSTLGSAAAQPLLSSRRSSRFSSVRCDTCSCSAASRCCTACARCSCRQATTVGRPHAMHSSLQLQRLPATAAAGGGVGGCQLLHSTHLQRCVRSLELTHRPFHCCCLRLAAARLRHAQRRRDTQEGRPPLLVLHGCARERRCLQQLGCWWAGVAVVAPASCCLRTCSCATRLPMPAPRPPK